MTKRSVFFFSGEGGKADIKNILTKSKAAVVKNAILVFIWPFGAMESKTATGPQQGHIHTIIKFYFSPKKDS